VRGKKGVSRTYRGSFFDSLRHAFDGLLYTLRAERNSRLHLFAAAVVVAFSLWLGLDTVEWALIIASIALVFAGEMLNTVAELTIDLITEEHHPVAKYAKDVAAGAILVAAIAAAAIGFLVLGPRLWARLVALGLLGGWH
jgi:diacylglycerol kinase